ncbi:carbohydrate ABC transporter permease [Psychrilyobacter atlanticus]|uniref:carbohydrate ABC transporter permease n=1 Tax=Psychrilyobacter atlanticus TaxID=271091 RepID=UPI000403807D|nr:carbohydrate ABC transporter permease [Psychrilyobacter atlanticus]
MVDSKNKIKTILSYSIIIIGVIVSLFPFYWMFIGATNSSADIFSFPPKMVPGKSFMKNLTALNEQIDLQRVIFNSFFVAITYTIFTLALSSITGYAFAKFEFKGRNYLFGAILLTMMLPGQATMIPLFDIMKAFGWLNSYKAVIIPGIASAFGIFLMRQNMLKVPDSLIEAARIDGCGEFAIFYKIVLPTMRPSIAALGIYMFMAQWGNFMWQLIVLNDSSMKTLPVALSSLVGLSRVDYGQVLLGASLSTLPVIAIFLILQKQFISGILGGALKE